MSRAVGRVALFFNITHLDVIVELSTDIRLFDFPPKAYAADGDDRMLEVANGGHAYYFDGNSLHVCVGVQGCTKIRGTKETPRTPEGIRSVLG